MQPPCEITPRILDLVARISRRLGRFEGLSSPPPRPLLRRESRVRTIRDTLAIEGNTLTLDQVTALVEGKRVAGPPREIREVQNALAAYSRLSEYNPLAIEQFRRAHGVMMEGLLESAGRFRAKNVGVFKSGEVTHIAPPARRVKQLMTELFEFLAAPEQIHPLVVACVFHYEIELIHPFEDGNGRMGRLWQTVLLSSFHPIFELLPVESIIRERQKDYYGALAESDSRGGSTPFVEFSLVAIVDSLSTFLEEFKPLAATPESRLEIARSHFGSRYFTRREYRALLKTISTATASRDLKRGVNAGLLEKRGVKARTAYVFSDTLPVQPG